MAAAAAASASSAYSPFKVMAVQAPPRTPSRTPVANPPPTLPAPVSAPVPVPAPAAAPPSLPAAACRVADDLINAFLDSPLRPCVDPRQVLAGNYAPVQELPPTDCTAGVRGTLPDCLHGGAYLRNGPNPRFTPRGGHHLFDGDGMVHALRILRVGASGHRVTFCSRFVRTSKLRQEEAAGMPLAPSMLGGMNGIAGAARGVLLGARVALGLLDPFQGLGTANTSLVFFNNRLLALSEADAPYALRLTADGDVRTLGRYDFDGGLGALGSMTAHPKADPATGELFAFRYSPLPPFLTFFRFSPSGSRAGADVAVTSLRWPCFIHDFAVTERYAVFPDTQLVLSPAAAASGAPAVAHEPAKPARIGILPRYATDDRGMVWFDVPGFNFIHAINAWDAGEHEVVLVAPNTFPLEHALERMHLVHCTVEMLRFDLATGVVTRRPLSALNLEFGVINPAYVGRRNRFAYAAVGDPMPKAGGIVKLDLRRGCVVAERFFGDGVFGGEPFFVPESADASGAPPEEEDAGYVVCFVHDEVRNVSEFLVMDARSPTLEIVASVRLPARVPYGFHGLFVTEEQIASQRP